MRDNPEALKGLLIDYKRFIAEGKELKERKKENRANIIKLMEVMGITDCNLEGHTAELKQPMSFDEAKFAKENDLLYGKFCKVEEITTTTTTFEKKRFEKAQPILYKKYQKKLSKRLTVK